MVPGPKVKLPAAADVVVVGGGPGGAATAIKCAEAGLRVTLIERDLPGRERPGETLHPGIEPLFAQLGIEKEILSANFLRHEGHWISWADPLHFEAFGMDERGAWRGFQVWRAEFDAILLRRARSVGVVIKQPCRVLRPLIEEGRVAGVATNEGITRARVVVDASGSRQWLAGQLRLPILKSSPRLIARYGYASGTCATPDETPTLIADTQGWTWTARVKPEMYAWTRLSFDSSKPEADWLPESLRGLERRGQMRAADVTWRIANPPAGSGYFLVGDAASVLDPASSHGILKAIMSGMMAAHLIIKMAEQQIEETGAARGYNHWVQTWFEHDTKRLKEMYAIFSTYKGYLPVNAKAVS
jgi:flavin-dependent dehydrogenase